MRTPPTTRPGTPSVTGHQVKQTTIKPEDGYLGVANAEWLPGLLDAREEEGSRNAELNAEQERFMDENIVATLARPATAAAKTRSAPSQPVN